MHHAFNATFHFSQNKRHVLALNVRCALSGYVQGLSFVTATLLRHTSQVTQLAGFTREHFAEMPFSQLAKVAAAEGVDASELQKTMRGGNKRDVLLEILLDLLPPEAEPEPEPEGGEGGEASVAAAKPVSLTWLPAVSLLTCCA